MKTDPEERMAELAEEAEEARSLAEEALDALDMLRETDRMAIRESPDSRMAIRAIRESGEPRMARMARRLKQITLETEQPAVRRAIVYVTEHRNSDALQCSTTSP